MNFVKTPYLVGLAILLFEIVVNLVTSLIFGFKLGEHNVSVSLLFLGAGYVVVSKTHKKMTKTYNIKVLLTYFLFVVTIVLVRVTNIGEVLNTLSVFLALTLLIFVTIVSYVLFVFGQNIMIKSLEKQDSLNKKVGV